MNRELRPVILRRGRLMAILRQDAAQREKSNLRHLKVGTWSVRRLLIGRFSGANVQLHTIEG
jgi:hypothetical protein